MSSSHRRDNPSRSAADAAVKHRNYRFKSYLEANTQERARFDSMQDHVPDKIAEVIASFREEKLTVHPHRNGPAVAFSDPMPTPRPRARAKAALAVPARPRQAWPWYLAALGLALGAMIWFDTSADPEPLPPVAVTVTPASPPVEQVPSAAATVAVHDVPATGTIERPPAISATAAAAIKTGTAVRETKTPIRRKAEASPSKTRAPEVDHYSEDLTGLLQGK